MGRIELPSTVFTQLSGWLQGHFPVPTAHTHRVDTCHPQVPTVASGPFPQRELQLVIQLSDRVSDQEPYTNSGQSCDQDEAYCQIYAYHLNPPVTDLPKAKDKNVCAQRSERYLDLWSRNYDLFSLNGYAAPTVDQAILDRVIGSKDLPVFLGDHLVQVFEHVDQGGCAQEH